MIAIEFTRKFPIAFNVAGEGLFEQDSLACAKQGSGMFPVLSRWGNDHGRIADPRFSETRHGLEDRHFTISISECAACAFFVRFRNGDEFARAGLLLKFTNVKKVDGSHPSQSGNRDP
jgi:hypothetical protein